MDERQKAAVAKHNSPIIDCIETNIRNALIDFCEDGASPDMSTFSRHDIDDIKAAGTAYAQTTELIRRLKQKENGFKVLTAALRRYGRERLAQTLEEDSRGGAAVPDAKPTNSHDGDIDDQDEAIVELLKSEKHWTTVLERLDVESIAAKLTKINENVRAQITMTSSQLTTQQKVDLLIAQLGRRIGTGAAVEFKKVLRTEQAHLHRKIFGD